jgi:hypothetical protein
VSAPTGSTREIPPPDPTRPPMQCNIFQVVRHSNTALVPMFPYTKPGCLVSGGSVFYGGPNRGIGVFNHMNSVDEVAICFASQGSGIRSGDVFSGAREHLVGSFFDEEEAPDNLMVIAVVQRQADMDIDQHEQLTFICAKCQKPISTHAFPSRNDAGARTVIPEFVPPLDTLTEGAVWAREFNEKAELRRCKECGHDNPKFPLDMWGWDAYTRAYEAAERGRELFLRLSAT